MSTCGSAPYIIMIGNQQAVVAVIQLTHASKQNVGSDHPFVCFSVKDSQSSFKFIFSKEHSHFVAKSNFALLCKVFHWIKCV